MKKAFTLIELIFVIVIIGVLASVAIPKFSGLTDNSKIASELSTAASVQVALDACHGEWIINEGDFTCGASINSSNLNSDGYPKNDDMNATSNTALDGILKNAENIGWTKSGTKYRGSASKSNGGVSNCKDNKPCTSKYWNYDESAGTFKLTSE